ncbi:MAG: sulfur transferase domain-containing protein, partial [Rhodospirillaceae bacterium]
PRATGNPCAPARPAAANPCAARSPAAPAMPANPCAAQAVTGDSANPFDTKGGHAEAPYGDKMPDIVSNYLRAAPYVGTGGVVRPGAFVTLRDLGFRSVINLNTADEGAAEDGRAATEAGLGYANLPVTELAPLSEQVDAFSRHVNDPANYPVLVYCQSSNRVGAMWALYRARNGVPPEIAIQEGRTVGLKPSREVAVREVLGLPPQ